MTYSKKFLNAIHESKKRDIDVSDITIDLTSKFINDSNQEDILNLFKTAFEGKSEEDKGECLLVSLTMKKIVEDYFCTDAYITIGNVYYNDVVLHWCSYEYIDVLLKEPSFKQNFKSHVWLTLSSCEMIDFSLFNGFANLYPECDNLKNKIITDNNTKEANLIYNPIVIGTDFLKKSKLMKTL